MLNYRATPLTNSDKSPAELLFSRRLRTKLPVTDDKLVPTSAKEAHPQLGRSVDRTTTYALVDRNNQEVALERCEKVKDLGVWLSLIHI